MGLLYPWSVNMGISRDRWHKRRKTGGRCPPIRKKRKFELGRPPANTKIGAKRIHLVRCMGGNIKRRALRLDSGNFSWGSEHTTRKTRIIDSTPFRQWYENHYALPLGRKKGAKLTEDEQKALTVSGSKKVLKKFEERKKTAKVAQALEEQFTTGRLLACLSSRPGQCGRADGYILEGNELDFYLRKIRAKKGK